MTLALFAIIFSFITQVFNVFKRTVTSRNKNYEKYYLYADILSICFLLYVGVNKYLDDSHDKKIQQLSGSFGSQNDVANDSFPHLFLGSSDLYFVPNPISFDGERNGPIVINELNHQIQIISYIRDSKGNTIAKVLGREWHITNASDIDYNADDSAFEIVDAEERVIYQLELKYNHAHFQGIIYSGFSTMAVPIEDNKLIKTFSIKDYPQRFVIPATLNIKKLFKYPRKDYVGVRDEE